MVRFKEAESLAAQVIREANERVEESIAYGHRLIETAGQEAWRRLLDAIDAQPREMDAPAGVGGEAEIPTCTQHPGVELDDEDRCEECEKECSDLACTRCATVFTPDPELPQLCADCLEATGYYDTDEGRAAYRLVRLRWAGLGQ